MQTPPTSTACADGSSRRSTGRSPGLHVAHRDRPRDLLVDARGGCFSLVARAACRVPLLGLPGGGAAPTRSCASRQHGVLPGRRSAPRRRHGPQRHPTRYAVRPPGRGSAARRAGLGRRRRPLGEVPRSSPATSASRGATSSTRPADFLPRSWPRATPLRRDAHAAHGRSSSSTCSSRCVAGTVSSTSTSGSRPPG